MLKRIKIVTSLLLVLAVFGLLQLTSGGLFFNALKNDKENFTVLQTIRQQQRHQKDDEEVTGHYIFFINCHSARLLKTLNSQFSTLHLFNKVRRIRRSLQIAFLT